MNIKEKKRRLDRRKKRIRAKVEGTKKVPRLAVYRSLSHIYAQLIDDETGDTLIAADDLKVKTKEKGKEARAFAVGKDLAQKARRKKIKKVIFDRGGRAYHGRIKALARGAREGGLKF